MFKNKPSQTIITLKNIKGQYYIADTVPVEIISDHICGGVRVICLKQLDRRKEHLFRVRYIDIRKNKKRWKLHGIILRS